MTATWRIVLVAAAAVACLGRVPAQHGESKPASAPAPNSCVACHSDPERFEGAEKKFLVSEKNLEGDVHWQQGLRCADCHGGDPAQEEYAGAHSKSAGFKSLKSRADIPDFCGKCHSDVDFMRRYRPSVRIDQVAEYWTSGHGKKLKADGDPKVATCTTCHGHHGIRRVDDLASPVYPTRVADTCAQCHSDAKHMEGYQHRGKPIGSGQRELWKESVHGLAMIKKGDTSAPTCNDCHGNHGAVAPEIGSVANACGTCHGKIADLFRETRMRHQFAEVGLPGCATCHGYHDIRKPSDEMLGAGPGTVCAKCHADQKFGATPAGFLIAKGLRDQIELLKSDIHEADGLMAQAEKLGMEVRASKFELGAARTALTNARSMIHTFSAGPVEKAVGEGRKVAAKVKDAAHEAFAEHQERRVWLGWSLGIIVILIAILVACIRRIPLPAQPGGGVA
jgi:predicted CXXCH cytochrome family protein